MSGRPYKYSRGMAIAQLMVDQRRPVIRQGGKNARQVFLDPATDELYVSYSDTIDWVPKLSRLTRFGREAHYIMPDKPEVEGQPYIQWGEMEIKPIEGWPTEEEIAKEIADSEEREKRGGGLAFNDFLAMKRMIG